MRHKPVVLLLCLIVLLARAAVCEDGPVNEWQFDAAHIKEQAVKAAVGALDARVAGPVQFSTENPQSLILDGDSKAGHCVVVTEDIGKAGLPVQNISVEAWVWIDKTLEWGGIVSAMQDNGDYEKGWILGYGQTQFYFGVSSKAKSKLTYLKAKSMLQPACWYHVVGTYDGTEQRIYVDGKLQGSSKEQRGAIDYPPHAFYTIGAYHDDDEMYAMAGRLDRAAVFDRALSAEQIAERYSKGQARFPGITAVRPVVSGWPTYLRDAQRTGQATEKLSFPLQLKWSSNTRFPPRPAWPEEAKTDYYNNKLNLEERVTYDRAFQLVGVGDSICFASSAEDSVYCLDAESGRQRWAFSTEGPVRLAPTIAGERVLFGSDDGFVYALNLKDGALLWKRMLAPGPRRIPGNERIISAWPVRTDVLVEEETAYVCAGVFAAQGVYEFALKLSDGSVLEKKTLDVSAQGYLKRFAGRLQVATGRNPAGAFVASLKAHGKEVGPEASTLSKEFSLAFIGAGNARIGGGDGKIAAFGEEDGKQLWSANVEGRVYSLAVVGEKLFASTDAGRIYCFAAAGKAAEYIVNSVPPVVEPAYSNEAEKKRSVELADAIVARAGFARGYCVVLGSGEGHLVYELTKRTQWHVIGREPDAEKAARSRTMLNAAGLGGRAVIHQGALDALPYSDYVFNVVVGESSAEALRVLRPEGGVLIAATAELAVTRRGPLEGAGEWTHLYGSPANTACSNDRLVGGDRDLQIQWFGRPGPRGMIDRHHRTAAPLYKNGRLFVPGDDRVTAVDAYNGTILWELEIPNSRRTVVFRDSSYLALADDALYVASPEACLALDPLSGKQQRAFQLPASPKNEVLEWGYVATMGEVLLGSAVKPGTTRRQQSRQMTLTETHWDAVPIVGSDALFALDRRTGRTLWTYASQAGLIINPTITSDGNAIYFVESANAETLKKSLGRAKLEELVGKGARIVALDLQTGKVLWSRSEKALEPMQHNLFAAIAQGVLILDGSHNTGPNKKSDKLVYEIQAYDLRSGELKWAHTQKQSDSIGGEHGEQERHPAIVGNTLFCEPRAYELQSGNPVEWKWPWQNKRRTGCGTIAASATTFFFRNDTASLFDLGSGELRKITAETRPGCWINLLPVGGLLLAPEASSGCTCNYAVQTSLAFIPVAKK